MGASDFMTSTGSPTTNRRHRRHPMSEPLCDPSTTRTLTRRYGGNRRLCPRRGHQALPRGCRERSWTVPTHNMLSTSPSSKLNIESRRMRFGICGDRRATTVCGPRPLEKLFCDEMLPVMDARAGASQCPPLLRRQAAHRRSRLTRRGSTKRSRSHRQRDARSPLQMSTSRSGRSGRSSWGYKVSRGFTIEGLTVSFYRRRTNQADTLMQMAAGSDSAPATRSRPSVHQAWRSAGGGHNFDLT